MFIMVMWDLTVDPFMSTMSHHWEWHHGGAYFGVPIQNFYGWYLCTFTMFFLFALYMSYQKDSTTPAFVLTKSNWLQMTCIYLTWPVTYVLMGLFAVNEEVEALNGQIWMSQDILKSGGLIGVGTMVFIAVLVLMKVYLLETLPDNTK
jgi:putative membrane protein